MSLQWEKFAILCWNFLVFFVTIQLHVLLKESSFLHHVHITMILTLELWNIILCCCTSTNITFVELCVLLSIIFCDSLFGLIYHWMFCITGCFMSPNVCSYGQLDLFCVHKIRIVKLNKHHFDLKLWLY